MSRLANIVWVVAGAVLAGCAARPLEVVELPSPNTPSFTFAEAEARKPEIYSLEPTGQWTEWETPFLGFAVQITCEDEIEGYRGFDDPEIVRSGRMSLDELEEVLAFYSALPDGNALAVLLTSECDPRTSETFPLVLDLLFQPTIQIHYVRRSDA